MVAEKVNNALRAQVRGSKSTLSKIKKTIFVSILMAVSSAIAACQTNQPDVTSFTVQSDEKIAQIMPRLVALSTKCLAGSGKPFPQYRVSSELNSLSGQPRVLLVRSNDVQGLPGLVILGQAKNTGTELSVFGRLIGVDNEDAVVDNLQLWAKGGDVCV